MQRSILALLLWPGPAHHRHLHVWFGRACWRGRANRRSELGGRRYPSQASRQPPRCRPDGAIRGAAGSVAQWVLLGGRMGMACGDSGGGGACVAAVSWASPRALCAARAAVWRQTRGCRPVRCAPQRLGGRSAMACGGGFCGAVRSASSSGRRPAIAPGAFGVAAPPSAGCSGCWRRGSGGSCLAAAVALLVVPAQWRSVPHHGHGRGHLGPQAVRGRHAGDGGHGSRGARGYVALRRSPRLCPGVHVHADPRCRCGYRRCARRRCGTDGGGHNAPHARAHVEARLNWARLILLGVGSAAAWWRFTPQGPRHRHGPPDRR